MDAFIEKYKEHVGEWNDEAGTKVYALDIILGTLQKAGAEAIDDVEMFKAAMADFSMPNPYVNDGRDLNYVGSAYFEQPRQIAVPMVVNSYQDGVFETLFVGAVE